MSDALVQRLRLDRGLTEILPGQGEAAPALPASRPLDPPDAASAHRLESLLAPRGLAGELEAALVPDIDDRSLLLPGPFRRALDDARALLARSAGGEDGGALAQALRIVDEDLALRDLAAMYRGLLVQG